jgi:hypothetical protein
VRYFEGNSQGKLVSIEFTDEGMDLSLGEELDFDEVTVNGE